MPLIRAMALLAAVLLACAPGISRLLAHGESTGGWAPLCTTEGIRWVAVPAGTAAPADSTPHGDADCGYCPLSAGLGAPPPLPRVALVHIDASRPAIAYRAPARFRTPQSSLGSRGPPTA